MSQRNKHTLEKRSTANEWERKRAEERRWIKERKRRRKGREVDTFKEMDKREREAREREGE